MDYTTLALDKNNGVAKITLQRAKRMNAFNYDLLIELRNAVRHVRDDKSSRCLLITGEGRGFCAGADLSDENTFDNSQGPIDAGKPLEDHYNALILAIRQLPKPVVTAVNGSAAGAGMSLALSGDIVIAAKSATFLQAFSRLGLIPDMGSTWMLPRMIGTPRAMALAMLAEPISAEQALDWGMIYQVCEDEALMETAEAMAERLAQAPTKGLGLLKKAMYASGHNTFSEQLALERELQCEAGRTRDCVEGIQAFFGKRPPKFIGE